MTETQWHVEFLTSLKASLSAPLMHCYRLTDSAVTHLTKTQLQMDHRSHISLPVTVSHLYICLFLSRLTFTIVPVNEPRTWASSKWVTMVTSHAIWERGVADMLLHFVSQFIVCLSACMPKTQGKLRQLDLYCMAARVDTIRWKIRVLFTHSACPLMRGCTAETQQTLHQLGVLLVSESPSFQTNKWILKIDFIHHHLSRKHVKPHFKCFLDTQDSLREIMLLYRSITTSVSLVE